MAVRDKFEDADLAIHCSEGKVTSNLASHDLNPKPAPDYSELCMSCGLCCNGVLYSYASLKFDEIDTARQRGLHTFSEDGEWVFHQPCPCYAGNGCAIYANRPQVCRNFRCKLIERYLQGAKSPGDCFDAIAQVKGLIRSIAGRLGSHDTSKTLWQVFEESLADSAGITGSQVCASPDFETAKDLATLKAICLQHFYRERKREEPDSAGAPNTKFEYATPADLDRNASSASRRGL